MKKESKYPDLSEGKVANLCAGNDPYKKRWKEFKCTGCGTWHTGNSFKAQYADKSGLVFICPNCSIENPSHTMQMRWKI